VVQRQISLRTDRGHPVAYMSAMRAWRPGGARTTLPNQGAGLPHGMDLH
jgi:hypothetical protein